MKINKKYLLKDFTIISVIVLIPFAFYLYTFVPKNKVWETSWFTLNAGEFETLDYVFWIFSCKILVISILSIWYLTCRNWWRSILLFSIAVEVYKFVSFLDEIFFLFENFTLFHSLPFSLLLISMLLMLSKMMKYNKLTIAGKIDNEITIALGNMSKNDSKKNNLIKNDIRLLKKNRNNLSKKEYLTQLIMLRDSFIVD